MIFNTFHGKGYISKISKNGKNIFVDVAVLTGIDELKNNIYQYGSFFAGDQVNKLFSNLLEHQTETENGFNNPLSGVMVDIDITNMTSSPWQQGDKSGINTHGILTKVSCG